jgi:crotonobetainyl-CoA:carnitine CoA-transferase CaiB-like acyl-CoA transferase
VSTYYLCANRNQWSIVLDLRTEEGREVARALAARADVVLENFRPGVMERLGLGDEVLRRDHPRLISVAIHAFGDDGPAEWTTRPGYDLVLQAMGGGMSITGTPEGPPVRSGAPQADLLAGLQAVQAVLLGLLHREKTGEGQKIVINMMQGQWASLVYHATRYLMTDEIESRRGSAHRGLVPYDTFPCADGWITIACGNDAIWRRLCEVLDLSNREDWQTNAGRVADRAAVDAAVRARTVLETMDALDGRLSRAGVPAGKVLAVDEVARHPVVQTVSVAHPVLGAVRLPGPTLHTATTRTHHTAPPSLGADRDDILAELGWDASRIAVAAAAGAFGAVRRADAG